MANIVTRESLTEMLLNADADKRVHIIGRALVALLDRQTNEEKIVADARVFNQRGFSKPDAKSGTLGAKYYLKNKTLKDWHVEKWMREERGAPRIAKYWQQLNEVAERKASRAA